jgi:hypothetical protein
MLNSTCQTAPFSLVESFQYSIATHPVTKDPASFQTSPGSFIRTLKKPFPPQYKARPHLLKELFLFLKLN